MRPDGSCESRSDLLVASYRLGMSNRIECPERAERVEGHDPVGVPDQYYVYILRCADGTFYVGATTELTGRVEAHNAGRGPRFTACRRPVSLVYSEPHATMESARGREVQIKKWSRDKKEALISGNMGRLHELSRRHIRQECFRTRVCQEAPLTVRRQARTPDPAPPDGRHRVPESVSRWPPGGAMLEYGIP